MPGPRDLIESVVRAFFAEALNLRDLEAFDRFCAPGYLWHGMDGAEVKGLEPFKREVEVFFEAFPDIQVDVRDVVVGSDRAAVCFRESGTHTGQFADLFGMLEKLGALSLEAPGHSA